MKGVYIFLAEGFEETEALSTLDVLRRGGVEVFTVGLNEDGKVSGSHNLTVSVDKTWNQFLEGAVMDGTSDKDVMIFPGGMPGTKNLAANDKLMSLADKHFADGGTVAAICAAPGLVGEKIKHHIKGCKFTCYDSFEKYIEDECEFVKAPFVVDGRFITGRCAGAAIDFGFAILERIRDAEVAASTRAAMCL